MSHENKHEDDFHKGVALRLAGYRGAVESLGRLVEVARCEGREDEATALAKAHAELSERIDGMDRLHAGLGSRQRAPEQKPQIIPPTPRGCADGD